MLTRLYIENFALIERVEIEFGPGLNAITGETGAGKSILLGALNCILGEAARSDLVRGGCERCIVEGIFEFDEKASGGKAALGRLRDLEVDVTDDQLVLRREIRASSRSRCFVNGGGVPLKRLAEIGNALVDLHGQHEHQSLLDEQQHARFLDECGQLVELSGQVRSAHSDAVSSDAEVEALVSELRALQREEELRQFQLDEIRRLTPEAGEDEKLESELRVLENQAELANEVGDLFALLYQNEGSVVELLGRSRRQLDRLVDIDPRLGAQAETVEQLLIGVEDLATGLREYLEALDSDPLRLEQTRERLFELRRLIDKHGQGLAEIIALAGELENKSERLHLLGDEIAEAERRRARALSDYSELCLQLSAERARAADLLSGQVERGLAALGVESATFEIEATREENPGGMIEIDGAHYRADESGLERVSFLFSANPGEPVRPLARVASGGEISRVMLVLKAIIAERDVVSTLVFDEIDSGISGRTAAAVGHRLEQLGRSHQTLAITHLPQIASLADRHFSVRKTQRHGRTVTDVHHLVETDARRDEIAQLLAGESLSATARKHAQELLK